MGTPRERNKLLGRIFTLTTSSALRRGLAAMVPLGRLAAPEEIARAVLFLACAETSSFMTGEELAVNGGLSAF